MINVHYYYYYYYYFLNAIIRHQEVTPQMETLGNRKQYRWMGRLEQVRETTLCVQRTKHVCVWLFPLYGFPHFAMAILFAWVIPEHFSGDRG